MSQDFLQKTQSRRSAAADGAQSSNLRVIVVDDDPIFRSITAAKLLPSAGEVVEAEDGSVGWYRISTETYHLAVVDLDMPNMGGIDLIRCVRGHPRTARLPIVVVTSRSPKDAMQESLECGATSFLCKPINWSTFSKHIDGLMNLYGSALKGQTAIEELQSARALHHKEMQALRHEASGLARDVIAKSRTALDSIAATGADSTLVPVLNEIAKIAEQASGRWTGAGGLPKSFRKPGFAA